MVLSCASPFFHRLLLENPCRHPIVILPSGVALRDLETIVEFVYGGEVAVAEDRVEQVLREEDMFAKHTAENPTELLKRQHRELNGSVELSKYPMRQNVI